MQPPVIIYAFLATIVFYNVGWWVGWYETVVSDEDEARDKKAPVFTGTLCVCVCVCVYFTARRIHPTAPAQACDGRHASILEGCLRSSEGLFVVEQARRLTRSSRAPLPQASISLAIQARR